MGFLNFGKKDEQSQQRQPGNPTTMVMFRILAIGYVLWMLKDFVMAYVNGAEDAPSLLAVIGVSVLFVGACTWLGIMTYKQWKQMKEEYQAYNEEVARQYAEQERLAQEQKELEEAFPEDAQYYEEETEETPEE